MEKKYNGAIKTAERYRKINEEFYKNGEYEKLSRPFRRMILLKETNNTCEVCKNSTWLDKPIWLEVHHKDDDNKNNKRENLLVVCPNCHSAIDKNYRFNGRKHETGD